MSDSIVDLSRFRTELLRDVCDSIYTGDNGGIKEEKFTELVLEYLEEAGETEGAMTCREIRENKIGNRIHKINGYAISENHETLDLFITVFQGFDELGRIYSEELKIAAKLSFRFVQNLFSGKIVGIEETAPVYDLMQTVTSIYNDIARINIFILSDMRIPTNAPESVEINRIPVNYFIRDIEYLHRIHISGSGRNPVNVDFIQKFNKSVPCISMPEENEDYMSYLAIIPAGMLADIYQDYGARLLEQNVRTFLQFRGNINKGIRDTIIQKPHMFLAYNNGISATAESVEITSDQKEIQSIKDFQIVNGGQTTASIFQTKKRFKNIDIDSVYVQLKLTVISDERKKSKIVSDISKYANTQNKVSEADLSSNDPFHIEIEHLSRKIWASYDFGKKQSRWFYERARGQYNDELYNIDSKAKQKKWLKNNPKSQKFAKEDLARFYMSWEMKPWWVVRGRQKNFGKFMNLADDIDINETFFEDIIAKAIIFRICEKLYGTGINAIGDLRYMVVPYAISWLRFVTDNQINLFSIWKNQTLSDKFQEILFSVLQNIDKFMRETAPGGLIGEWAKKEDCWKKLRKYDIGTDISDLETFFYSQEEMKVRYQSSILDTEHKKLIEQKVKELNAEEWIDIEQWGRATEKLELSQINFIWKIIRKIDNNKALTDKELIVAEDILKIKAIKDIY